MVNNFLGFVDASIVAMAERLKLSSLVTTGLATSRGCAQLMSLPSNSYPNRGLTNEVGGQRGVFVTLGSRPGPRGRLCPVYGR